MTLSNIFIQINIKGTKINFKNSYVIRMRKKAKALPKRYIVFSILDF